MTLAHRFFTPCHAILLAGSLALTLAIPVRAQQLSPAFPGVPETVESYPFEIGHAAKPGAVYTVTATQPATSKLTGQKLCLKIVETTDARTTTRYYTLATGKHKTVAQLVTTLSEILQRFLSNPPPHRGRNLARSATCNTAARSISLPTRPTDYDWIVCTRLNRRTPAFIAARMSKRGAPR